jgi:tetratricopeptide (TPR) repeat protein
LPEWRPSEGQYRQALQQALQLHRQGRLEHAEGLYRAILEAHPSHFEANHLLGVIRTQQGRNAEAFDLISSAVKADPVFAAAFLHLGSVLGKLGRADEALASFDRALALRPDYPEAHDNRGNALRDLKRLGQALESYERALANKPDYVDALNNRGVPSKISSNLTRHSPASIGRLRLDLTGGSRSRRHRIHRHADRRTWNRLRIPSPNGK